MIHEDENDDDSIVSECDNDFSERSDMNFLVNERINLRRDVYTCDNADNRLREYHEGIEINDMEAARNLVNSCSVVVGMHPDQAAEHIVDFALQNKKPFVLIPCCVYHKQFPHRSVVLPIAIRGLTIPQNCYKAVTQWKSC